MSEATRHRRSDGRTDLVPPNVLHVQGVKLRELPKFCGIRLHVNLSRLHFIKDLHSGGLQTVSNFFVVHYSAIRWSTRGSKDAGSRNLVFPFWLNTVHMCGILHGRGGEIYLDNGLEIPKPQSS